MIQVGKYYSLKVLERCEEGLYLGQEMQKEDKILLPTKELLEQGEVENDLTVFIYRDAQGRKLATLRKPKISIGEMAPLKVVAINHIGAFLDWGLEKDLFMPFKEQEGLLHKGETYLVGMYEDKSGRLCATMHLYEKLQTDSPYKVNDRVEGTIYNIKEAYGAFVAVDNKYHGMIPLKEMYGECKVGQQVVVRVKQVREDGKLELSLRKTTHLQMEDDARKIMEALDKGEGYLNLHDKSEPEAIKNTLQMSKAAFKRAVGRLMKEGVVTITHEGIKRNW